MVSSSISSISFISSFSLSDRIPSPSYLLLSTSTYFALAAIQPLFIAYIAYIAYIAFLHTSSACVSLLFLIKTINCSSCFKMSTPNNNNPPMTPEVANQIMLRRSLHYRRNTRPVSPLARSNRLQAIRGDLAQQFPAIHQLRSHAATLQLELEELRTANANNASDNFAQRGALEQRLTTATRNHRAAEEALAPLRRQLATAQAEAVTAQQQLTTAEQQADPDLRARE